MMRSAKVLCRINSRNGQTEALAWSSLHMHVCVSRFSSIWNRKIYCSFIESQNVVCMKRSMAAVNSAIDYHSAGQYICSISNNSMRISMGGHSTHGKFPVFEVMIGNYLKSNTNARLIEIFDASGKKRPDSAQQIRAIDEQ